MVDGADLLQLVGDELIALVEEQHAELLTVGKGLGAAAVIEHGGPGRQRRPFPHLAAQEPARRRLHELELGDGRLAQSLALGEPRDRRGNDFGKRAEGRDQRFGERLDIAPRQGAKQHQFQELVVG